MRERALVLAALEAERAKQIVGVTVFPITCKRGKICLFGSIQPPGIMMPQPRTQQSTDIRPNVLFCITNCHGQISFLAQFYSIVISVSSYDGISRSHRARICDGSVPRLAERKKPVQQTGF
jgi:hypothetical protein